MIRKIRFTKEEILEMLKGGNTETDIEGITFSFEMEPENKYLFVYDIKLRNGTVRTYEKTYSGHDVEAARVNFLKDNRVKISNVIIKEVYQLQELKLEV